MDLILRKNVVDALKQLDKKHDINSLAREYGTPLLVLETNKVTQQYKRLQKLLPFVRFHYAMKSLDCQPVLRAVRDCGGYFDVATRGEVEKVRRAGIDPSHCMHTHPIKTPAEIDTAYRFGIRRFVVDNTAEIDKFRGLPSDIKLMLRLSFRNPQATGGDLSFKYGAEIADASRLVEHAVKVGVCIDGVCLHVGSQIHRAEPYSKAISETLQFIDVVESRYGIRLRTLDIGGGFPVSYRSEATDIVEIADAIRPLLEPLTDRFTILAEPGRFVSAPAMTLICSVVGKTQRYGKTWYYLDEGLYGAYSIIYMDHNRPAIVAVKELQGEQPLSPTVLAGPTCDSVDMVDGDYAMPDLEIGDLVISPNMGAYTAVTACKFNSLPLAKVVEV